MRSPIRRRTRRTLLGGLVLHYCVHPEAAMFAEGEGGLIAMRGVLDEIVARGKGKEHAVPKPVAERRVGRRRLAEQRGVRG